MSQDFSLIGKIYVVKSLGLSQILYPLEMINIDPNSLEEIMKVIWKFLWNGKRCYLSPEICMLPRGMGGLGLPNIEIIIKVRRIKMLVKIIEEKSLWNLIARKHIIMLFR